MADAFRQRGVDDQVIADRLEAQHRPQQQQLGRPVDHAWALYAVGTEPGSQRTGVAAERLGTASVEELGRIEDARGLLTVWVTRAQG